MSILPSSNRAYINHHNPDSRIQNQDMDLIAHLHGLPSPQWYHCQLCIHKLRARYNLKNNNLTAKYYRVV